MLTTIQRTLTIGGATIRLRIPADPEEVLQEAVEGTEAGNRFVDLTGASCGMLHPEPLNESCKPPGPPDYRHWNWVAALA